jgi:hypothetical protein
MPESGPRVDLHLDPATIELLEHSERLFKRSAILQRRCAVQSKEWADMLHAHRRLRERQPSADE